MLQFASRDGDDDLEGAHEGDALTGGGQVGGWTNVSDGGKLAKESMLNALAVLFFVLLGVVVIAATVKSHAEYKRTGTVPFAGGYGNSTLHP